MWNRWMERLESVPALVFSGICLLLGFVPHIAQEFGMGGIFAKAWWLDPVWGTILVSGLPLVTAAVRKLVVKTGVQKISSALLISVAMIAAIAIGDRFAAGEVAFIMALGEWLEEKTTARAKRGLHALIGLTPVTGRRITPSGEEILPAQHIQTGDILRVLPGETVPVDGVILQGDTSVDQAILTGESLPVDKTVGDTVFCGTLNRFGSVDIRATKVGESSSLHTLIRLVKEAQNKQAPIQRIADTWAGWLVPVALLLALVAGWITQDVVVAVTVLVVFCPCALVLATPTAIMAAIGQATKHGAIIKSGQALEALGRVDTVALDKTGTLTYGRLQVTEVLSFDPDRHPDEVLALVAAAESRSEHPLGKAIVAKAHEQALPLAKVGAFHMEAGRGVSATVGEYTVRCGNEAYINQAGIPLSPAADVYLNRFQNEGQAVVLAACNNTLLGMVALADRLKPEAAQMVAQLQAEGVKTVLLTGDNPKAAAYFAAQAGIDEVHAALLPAQKVAWVSAQQQQGHTVCMIGDGVNDAPALKAAGVGIAMGTAGSDLAIEAADIALMGDDLSKIPYLKRLSAATVRTIKRGIALSLLINFAAIALSFWQLLTPTTGALVHNAGSCLVVLIAARLYDRSFDK